MTIIIPIQGKRKNFHDKTYVSNEKRFMNNIFSGIWMDGKEAYILHIGQNVKDIKHIHSDIDSHERYKGEDKSYTRMGNAFIDPESTEEHRRMHQAHRYFEHIVLELNDSQKFIVIGPAQKKIEFATWLEEKHPLLHKKLVEVITADKMTENQMFAYFHEYFGNKESLRN